jgi:glycyl-tRNA synthetase
MNKEKEFNLEKFSSWAKSTGFIFQSSEIYGGMQAIYDFAHYGALLRENIKNAWIKSMLKNRNIKYLDSAIFMDPQTWHASGHVDSFVDPEVDCKTCNNRMRADKLLEPFGVADADRMDIEEINELLQKHKDELQCSKCGGSDLTEAKTFDLLVKSNLGSPTSELSEDNVVYLRGETCQGIYLNYKNYIQNLRAKLPFGIAQVGKAFRNEIVARQYVFRTREFQQMEMQYFVHPDDSEVMYEEWKSRRVQWWVDEIGLPKDSLRVKPHEKLAHYAAAADDIEYNFKCLGEFGEIEGIHDRGDWDLSQHQKHSGEKLEYYDQQREERYIPNIVETAAGLNRGVLALLDSAYTEETLEDGSERVVLKLKPELAPIKAAIFPLQKKPELKKIAEEIYDKLSDKMYVEYDESGSIGKRYRRQDEVGTPYCITVDFESLEDGMVTIRDRDTLEQERVKIEELEGKVEV